MRKDERLRRGGNPLPPPSNRDENKKTKEVTEDVAIKGFTLAIFIAGVLLTLATASVYAGAGVIVLNILHDSEAINWKLSWVDAFVISLVFLFSRAWWRASLANEKRGKK